MNHKEIALRCWDQIKKFKAESIWYYEPGLWLPDNIEIPINPNDLNQIITEIYKLSKGEQK